MTTFRSLPPALSPYVDEPWWILWRFETSKNGRRTKVPYQVRNPSAKAKCNDPGTWAKFAAAQAVYRGGKADGIGFCLLGSGLAALDLDHRRDVATGVIEPAARDLIERAKSYAEITPSEAGLRIIGLGKGSKVHRKGPVPNANGMSIEVYRACERFITVTGNAL